MIEPNLLKKVLTIDFPLSKSEEVKIGERKGQYIASKEEQTLRWKDGDSEYTLIYYTEQSNKKLSKTDLIETAKSFK